LRHLVTGIGGVAAAVVEKITDVVRLEDLDQALVLALVFLEALELETAGSEGSRRRVLQRRDIGFGFA